MGPPRIDDKRTTPVYTPPTPATPPNTAIPPTAKTTPPPAFNGVSTFETGAPRPAAPVTGGPSVPLQSTYPTPAQIQTIASNSDPVSRNRAITQAYSDVSAAFAQVVGTDNANWATFGAWASDQAGVSIRGEDVPFIKDALNAANGPAKAIEAVNDILRKAGLPALPGLGEIITGSNAAMTELSKAIGDGNQAVFAEIAPKFAAYTQAFGGDTSYDQAKVDKFIKDNFKPSEAPLAEAFRNYAKAQFEKDPNKKSELMLLANAQVGAHEQTVLQPYIEKAMNSPTGIVKKLLKDTIEASLNAAPGGSLIRWGLEKTGLLDKAVDAVAGAAAGPIRQVITDQMMKLSLPGEKLKLGDDLPRMPGATSDFPKDLQVIDNPDAQALMKRFGVPASGLSKTGASDWANYDQRMKYIFDLFRSRGQNPALFAPPSGVRGTY